MKPVKNTVQLPPPYRTYLTAGQIMELEDSFRSGFNRYIEGRVIFTWNATRQEFTPDGER